MATASVCVEKFHECEVDSWRRGLANGGDDAHWNDSGGDDGVNVGGGGGGGDGHNKVMRRHGDGS
ncbi:hypothetical protein D8674_035398 [Pyrus ussuriensis x Pyrus communis]|uniref:Uncharacterized protein n=1 Tax=Pyrus ussuriensis x Pyrus communis TaxID=2448454 RepID=A0A5N5GHQ8_9ROSA|nr:hypothetical protein D8674_035398 [Pyrus ussuriensis x Pyrus communis]